MSGCFQSQRIQISRSRQARKNRREAGPFNGVPTLVVEVFPAAHFLPAVDDAAEQLCSLLGVVASRVGLAAVEVDSGSLAGLGQHGLTVGQACEGSGVEA